MKNTITYQGQNINLGETPQIVYKCGFSSTAEVRRAAEHFSSFVPVMNLDDVIEYLGITK